MNDKNSLVRQNSPFTVHLSFDHLTGNRTRTTRVHFLHAAVTLSAVGGSSRIRTCSAVKQQIYSLPRLSNFGVFPFLWVMSNISFSSLVFLVFWRKIKPVLFLILYKNFCARQAFSFSPELSHFSYLRWLWDSNPLSLRNGFADRPDSPASANHRFMSKENW